MTTSGPGTDDSWTSPARPFVGHPDGRGASSAPGRPPVELDNVRPYLLTGGRTAIRPDLNVETVVATTGTASPRPLSNEHLGLLRLAEEPQAVAELAARLRIPIGVVMILVGDLVEVGAVSLTDGLQVGAPPPSDDTGLIRKVVDGVLKLRNAETG